MILFLPFYQFHKFTQLIIIICRLLVCFTTDYTQMYMYMYNPLLNTGHLKLPSSMCAQSAHPFILGDGIIY